MPAADDRATSQSPGRPPRRSRDAAIGELEDALVAALREDYEERALAMLSQAIASGLSGPEIYLQVFQPALERISTLQQNGRVCVGDEHRATATVRWLMDALLDEFAPRPSQKSRGTVLAACAEGELHDVGLTMLTRFLRRDGWHVIDLGANVPRADYELLATRLRPRACLLSAATAERLPALAATIAALRSAGVAEPVLVGGVIFRREPHLAASVGATATAPDALAATALLGQVVSG